MQHKIVDIYKYSELSETAKEKARDWYKEAFAGEEDLELDYVLDDAIHIAGILGIEIASRNWTNSYGFKVHEPIIYYQAQRQPGDYVAFEGHYKYAKGAPKAIKGYTNDSELLRIAVALQVVQSRNFYQLVATTACRRSSMSVNVERSDSSEMTEGAEIEIMELLDDFAEWIYKQILAEFDYQNSDEYIAEALEDNKYEFLESGKRLLNWR